MPVSEIAAEVSRWGPVWRDAIQIPYSRVGVIHFESRLCGLGAPSNVVFITKKFPPPPSTRYVLVGSNLQPLQWQASALPSTLWRMSCKTLQIRFSSVSLQILEIIFEPFTANLNIFYGLSDWGQNRKGLKVYFWCFRISYYIWNQYLFSDTVLSMLRFTNRVIKPIYCD